MPRDTFEVYYNQNGRWQLHASFEASQRDLAIEEAKAVEQKEGYPTRVVRETFNSESNTTEDAITWQSNKAKNINDSGDMFGVGPGGGGGKAPPKQAPKKQAPAPAPARPAPRPAAPAQQQAPKQQQKSAAVQAAPVRKQGKKKKKQRGALMRFLIVIGTSAAIAIVCAIATSFGVIGLVNVGMLPQRDYTAVVAGTFVLSFFMSMFVNLQKQFGILSMLKSGPKPTKRAVGPEMMMTQAPRKKPAQDVEFDQVTGTDLQEESVAEDLADDSAAIDAELDEEEAPPSLDADMGAEMSTDMGAQVQRAEPAEAQQPQQPAHQQSHAHNAPEPKREAPQPQKPAAPAPPQTPPAEAEARATFSKFVGDVMRHAPGDLNTFSRFGLNLYVAGAGSVIGQTKRLPRDAQLGVVKQGLQATGMPGDRAEAFCVELPSHGKNPKYAGMIQAGVKAMQEYLGGNAGVAGQIAALLSEWNLPEKRAAIPSVITFVFTDIVGSTAMTQRLGNAGAQKAVRAHNTAVRGAIQAYKGREVKHTGDGIMATFPDPPSAVAACIKIQREIAAHNSANPNVDVHLRIGINAGEAVEEENDFFGAAVQMTARICDKAAKDNIWVSQAVVDGCKGQKFGFIPRGAFEMKGIQGSKRLFEVGWSDAHKNELADL
ncbi:MAG: adenylate/guanylate cyclase domain-containing protein [Rhodospirillaceae bacterium]